MWYFQGLDSVLGKSHPLAASCSEIAFWHTPADVLGSDCASTRAGTVVDRKERPPALPSVRVSHILEVNPASAREVYPVGAQGRKFDAYCRVDRLDSDTLQSLSAAFEEARSILGLRTGNPRTFNLAKKIVEFAQTGECDLLRSCPEWWCIKFSAALPRYRR